jgi:alpha-galactosidase
MEGQGSIEHLQALLANETTAPKYQHLQDADGNWAVRNDVYVRYNERERQGKLTTGFGFRTHKFGPELQFGHVVGNYHPETVLIIKATWGGSSLAADFRPPSAGLPVEDYDLMGDDGTPASAVNMTVGHRYRQMMALLNDTLDNIEKVIPECNGTEGYELLGFVWFQGFSDVIDERKLKEYSENLIYLINDVRRDLNLPNLPVTIGELGMQGLDPDVKHLQMRQIQRNVTELPILQPIAFAEIASHVVTFPTDGFDYDGAGNFHYNGRADNFFEIGLRLAETALGFAEEDVDNQGRDEARPMEPTSDTEDPIDQLLDDMEQEEEEEGGSDARRRLRAYIQR